MYSTPKPPHAKSRKDSWLKWLRVASYFCMATAGFLLQLSPVLTEVYKATAQAMSIFLLVGGTASFFGALREEWWGEFVGLPLLASSFATFGVISYVGAKDELPFLAGANLFLLLGVALAMMGRWRDARNTYRVAVFGAKKDEEKPL